MADIYTFDKRTTARIADTVRRSESQIVNTPSYRRRSRSRAKSGGSATVRPAKLTSGGSGLYKGDLLDESGEVIENDADFIATRATVYNLPADSYIVAYKVSVETLGGN